MMAWQPVAWKSGTESRIRVAVSWRRRRGLREAQRGRAGFDEEQAHQVRAGVAVRAHRALRAARWCPRCRRSWRRRRAVDLEVGQRRACRASSDADPTLAEGDHSGTGAAGPGRDPGRGAGRSSATTTARRSAQPAEVGSEPRRAARCRRRRRPRPSRRGRSASSSPVHQALSGTATPPAAAAAQKADDPLGEVAHGDGHPVAPLRPRSVEQPRGRWWRPRGSARRSWSARPRRPRSRLCVAAGELEHVAQGRRRAASTPVSTRRGCPSVHLEELARGGELRPWPRPGPWPPRCQWSWHILSDHAPPARPAPSVRAARAPVDQDPGRCPTAPARPTRANSGTPVVGELGHALDDVAHGPVGGPFAGASASASGYQRRASSLMVETSTDR